MTRKRLPNLALICEHIDEKACTADVDYDMHLKRVVRELRKLVTAYCEITGRAALAEMRDEFCGKK